MPDSSSLSTAGCVVPAYGQPPAPTAPAASTEASALLAEVRAVRELLQELLEVARKWDLKGLPWPCE